MSDAEPTHLILAPYRSHREVMLYPKSRVIKANCGHFCWLSSPGESVADTAHTICVDCYENNPIEDVTEMTVPGAVDFVRLTLGEDAARGFRRRMADKGITEWREP